MQHKIYMNYIHPSSLLRQLSDLWKTEQLCDAVITVDKIIVAKAHKVVLLAISPKLKSDSCNTAQCPILDVCLPAGVSHRAVHAFLQYIYEGYLILTEKLAFQLRKIADFLQIKCLSNCCSDYLDSLVESDNVIVLDEEVPVVKTEEFTHVRTSAVEDILKKRLNEGGEDVPSASKRHKHSSSTAAEKESSPPPLPVSQHSSPRSSQSTFRAPDVSPLRGHQPSPQKTAGGQTIEIAKTEIKTEASDDCLMEEPNNSWSMNSGPQVVLNPIISSVLSDGGGGGGGGGEVSSIKDEPQDESVELNYFDSSQDASSSDMWFSNEMGSAQQYSQGGPESSISSSMPGPSQVTNPQKSMTFSSLSQMRAQQSIKRSIQSSVSAARRARDIEEAQASSVSDDSALQGEQDGSESQEESFTRINSTGSKTNFKVCWKQHMSGVYKRLHCGETTYAEECPLFQQRMELQVDQSLEITPKEETTSSEQDEEPPSFTRQLYNSCDMCSYSTRRASNLVRHKKLRHFKIVHVPDDKQQTPKQEFLCDTCGKSLKSVYCLKMHIKTQHDKIFKFCCPHTGCNKKFNQSSNFKGHLASHNNDLKEQCDICKKLFVYKSSLVAHRKVCGHKKGDNDRAINYICNVCGHSFASRKSLWDHKRGIHEAKGYFCAVCGKRFSWRSSLSYHVRHTGHTGDLKMTEESF